MIGFFCQIILFISFMFLSACASMVHEPKISIQKTNIVGMDTAGVDLEFYLGVTNPNSYDITLLGYTYNLNILTLPMANAGSQQNVVFASGKTTDFRFPVRLKYSDILEILKRRPDPDKIPYQILARFQIDSPVGEMTIPVDEQATFSIPAKYRPTNIFNRLQNSLQSLN